MKELQFLNLLRGVSAVLVMLSHLRSSFFVDYENIVHPSLVHKVFYFLTGLGHQAVIVFFVLSGFLVGGSVLKPNYSLKSYFINRISRLWTVLIPALVFTFIIDFYFYDASSNSFRTQAIQTGEYSLNVDVFIGNVLFLQTIYFPTYGTNGPLWSLANEFWYYVIFPFIFSVVNKLRKYEIDFKSLMFFLLVTLWLPLNITLLFPVWLLGFFVYLFYGKFYTNQYLFVFVLLLFFSIIATTRFKIIDGLPADCLIGFSVAVLILMSPVIEKFFKISGLFTRFITWLSSISFSLYLFHYPLLVFYVGMSSTSREQPNNHLFIHFSIVSVSILLVSWALWFLFEKHTLQVREIMNKLFASEKNTCFCYGKNDVYEFNKENI